MTDDIQYLIEGHRKFQGHYFEQNRALYEALVKTGQRPKYLVVACSDSRVDPAILLDCKPGDLFVIRNVANLIPPCELDSHYHGTSAALEFGICGLGIRHLILLGHSLCGGITSLVDNQKKNLQPTRNSFLEKWVELATPACSKILKHYPNASTREQADLCAQESLLSSLENLKTFPWIRERIAQDQLSLHAWYFDLTTGHIQAFNAEEQRFSDVIGPPVHSKG